MKMITFEDFDRLAGEVAELLTSKPVRVKWRQPGTRGAIGSASKFIGFFVIEVDPDLELDQALKTFLHEVAHVRLHGDQMKVSALAVRASASAVYDFESEPDYYKTELEADALAEFWEGQARENAYMLTPYRMLEALKKLYSQ